MEILDTSVCQKVSSFFKALSDETRVKIIWFLKQNEVCVTELALNLKMSQSAVSHQLSTLRKANLVSYYKKGKEVFYYLTDKHVEDMINAGIEHVHK